jgi:hypothetical protein
MTLDRDGDTLAEREFGARLRGLRKGVLVLLLGIDGLRRLDGDQVLVADQVAGWWNGGGDGWRDGGGRRERQFTRPGRERDEPKPRNQRECENPSRVTRELEPIP